MSKPQILITGKKKFVLLDYHEYQKLLRMAEKLKDLSETKERNNEKR